MGHYSRRRVLASIGAVAIVDPLVCQPRKYELAINSKTARTIDFNLPRSLLVRADRVIE